MGTFDRIDRVDLNDRPYIPRVLWHENNEGIHTTDKPDAQSSNLDIVPAFPYSIVPIFRYSNASFFAMKILLQRVSSGRVTVDGACAGEVGLGYVALIGVKTGDTEADARHLAHKTVNLRVFPDTSGKMNLSVQDIGGAVLAISQFTLYADTRKGNRPGFTDAAEPESARALYEAYVDALRRELGEARVKTGVFGASMQVDIHNDGPVTIELAT